MRKRCLALVLALSCFLVGTAHAFPAWMDPAKKGPFMFNLKFGGAFGLRDITTGAGNIPSIRGDDFFTLVLEFGFAVSSDRNAYLLLPLQFQLHDTGAACPIIGQPCNFGTNQPWQIVMIPVGFQYDIPIKAVPGLYITPRIVAGYAAYIPDVGNVVNAGFVEAAVGVKLVIKKILNVGFEPLSLPIFFAPGYPSSGHTFVTVDWRLLWYAGVNF
jgi:hypothetical protein